MVASPAPIILPMRVKTVFADVFADAGIFLPIAGKFLPTPFFTDGPCERLCIVLGARVKPNRAGKNICGYLLYFLTVRG